MTSGTKGKYWDLVYASDIYGIAWEPLRRPKAEPSYSSTRIPDAVTFMALPNKSIHYRAVDSVNIVETQLFINDVIYDKSFKIISDSVFQSSSTLWRIEFLNDEFLILKGPEQVRQIYRRSAVQEKVIMDKIPSRRMWR